MPTISLRLTEQEHADLKRWAHDSRRSIQKEAVWRLFSGELESDFQVEKIGPATGVPREGLEVVADAQPRDIPARKIEPDPHFKPDFK